MPMYEIMFIIQPDVEGDLLEEAINKLTGFVGKEGARIVNFKRLVNVDWLMK